MTMQASRLISASGLIPASRLILASGLISASGPEFGTCALPKTCPNFQKCLEGVSLFLCQTAGALADWPPACSLLVLVMTVSESADG